MNIRKEIDIDIQWYWTNVVSMQGVFGVGLICVWVHHHMVGYYQNDVRDGEVYKLCDRKAEAIQTCSPVYVTRFVVQVEHCCIISMGKCIVVF